MNKIVPLKTDDTSLAFGGQAVIEGVMIRSQKQTVICVREHDRTISTVIQDIQPFTERYPILKFPLIRGVPAMVETLYRGIKGLILSANIALEEEGETFTLKEIAITLMMSLAIVSFFIVIPTLLAGFLAIPNVVSNIIEVITRFSLFLLYLLLVSQWSEVTRVFQYHGAEHKVINAYEAGEPLNLATAKKHSRLHPRCGTSFLFIVMLVSILLFSLLPSSSIVMRLVYRFILIPVIASLSYELLKLSGKYRNSKIIRGLIQPGLQLQRLTTKEPDDDMILVALQAVNQITS
ncbi:MAG: DUF1385 domain-containing protein [Candidatus Bathyarchaeota archaeon]|nr:MAG: DUF1385 domain-containing protein [Candidatus Bathyarchaeota archaeon]